MKEALDYIVNSLADGSDGARLSCEEEGNVLKFRISVAKQDRGKIIGREGRIIKSIRNFFQAIASKKGKKVFVDVV